MMKKKHCTSGRKMEPILLREKVALDDLEEILGIEIEDEENETLNGFLISKLERIPAEHETCEVRYDVYCFRILLS